MDRLSAMEVFTRVVESGGFSAAARHLGLSKSAVSKQVAALEERLGVRLLNRTTRKLGLTDAGMAYHTRALRLLAEAEAMEAEVGHLTAAPRGVLRVNAPVTLGIRYLGPLLPEFLTLYPDMEVDLALNDRVVDLLEEGFDVAVRVANLPDSSLMARRLCPSRAVLTASPDYIAKRGQPQRPEELREHDCLLYSYLLRDCNWDLYGPGGEAVTVRIDKARLRANNGDVLMGAVERGLGITKSPLFIVEESLRAGRLVRVLPEWDDPSASVFAVHPHVRFTPAKVRVFVDFLADKLKDRVEWSEACRMAEARKAAEKM